MALTFTRSFVAIGSNEFEQSVNFYTRLLGREPDEKMGDFYVAFELPELRLGIFRPREQNREEFMNPKPNRPGLNLVFYVPDLEAAMKETAQLGCPPPGFAAEQSTGREVYTFDPTGNRIILFQKADVQGKT